ncbi:MAG: HEPN domain-containing protein [Anaerolineales bacterium]|nr:HEPN domain-containing protein [Anaerolineales bacterium]
MSEAEYIQETRRWLRYAHEDLQMAGTILAHETIAYRHVCWLAQQSVEKALKAALTFLQVEFPWWHDLDTLRNLLPDDWQVKAEFPDLAVLTEWAVEARYPGDWPEASEADARFAAEQARQFWESIKTDFAQRGIKIE